MIIIGDMRIDTKCIPEITDFTYADEPVRDYIRAECSKSFDAEFTATVRINPITYAKICGLWDWLIENCPNRRVVHLMRHSKDPRIVKKNYCRAQQIICKELERKGAKWVDDQT